MSEETNNTVVSGGDTEIQYAPRPELGRASSQYLGKFTTRDFLYSNFPPLGNALPARADPTVEYKTLQVVAKDPSTGLIVPAKKGDIAVGIISSGASNTSVINVFYSGHFIMQALVYDESYATDEDKLAAFNGATNLTSIAVSKTKF